MHFKLPNSAPTLVALSFVVLAVDARVSSGQLAGTAGLGAYVPMQAGPFVVQTGATADRIGSSIAPRTTLDVQSSVALPVSNGGVWLGVSAFKAREIDSLPVRPLLDVGLWRSFSDVTISIGAESHVARLGGRPPSRVLNVSPLNQTSDSGSRPQSDTTTHLDSGSSSHTTAWSDLEAGASWRTGRYTLDAIVGARPALAGAPRAVWGRVAATVQLASRVALVGGIGVQPTQLAVGVPSSRFATLSLNVAAWRRGVAPDVPPAPTTTFSVHRLEDARCRVAFHVQGAHKVELSGDFDNWSPIELSEVTPGNWEVVISAAAGTYHMNVRVDGAQWSAPPGTVEVADDFNGTVGIVVVR